MLPFVFSSIGRFPAPVRGKGYPSHLWPTDCPGSKYRNIAAQSQRYNKHPAEEVPPGRERPGPLVRIMAPDFVNSMRTAPDEAGPGKSGMVSTPFDPGVPVSGTGTQARR